MQWATLSTHIGLCVELKGEHLIGGLILLLDGNIGCKLSIFRNKELNFFILPRVFDISQGCGSGTTLNTLMAVTTFKSRKIKRNCSVSFLQQQQYGSS